MSIESTAKTTSLEIVSNRTGNLSLWGRIVDFFHKRTMPFPEVTDSEDRRKSRVLAGLTFVLSISLAIGAVANSITSTIDHGTATISLPPIETYLIGICAILTFIGYRYSRGRRY